MKSYTFDPFVDHEYILIKDNEVVIDHPLDIITSLHLVIDSNIPSCKITIETDIENVIIESKNKYTKLDIILVGDDKIKKLFMDDTNIFLMKDDVFSHDIVPIKLSSMIRFNNIYHDPSSNTTYEVNLIGKTSFLSINEVSSESLAHIDYIKDVIPLII